MNIRILMCQIISPAGRRRVCRTRWYAGVTSTTRGLLAKVVFLENGSAEAHVIRKEFSALMPEENDLFALFLQRTM